MARFKISTNMYKHSCILNNIILKSNSSHVLFNCIVCAYCVLIAVYYFISLPRMEYHENRKISFPWSWWVYFGYFLPSDHFNTNHHQFAFSEWHLNGYKIGNKTKEHECLQNHNMDICITLNAYLTLGNNK